MTTDPHVSRQATYKQLRRSRTYRVLGGVCGGIADYFNIDPTLVRAGFAVATVLTGGALAIAYVALLFIMPDAAGSMMGGAKQPQYQPQYQAPPSDTPIPPTTDRQ